MKVEIVTKRELKDPKLEITISLETGKTEIELQYTCQQCAGYGCHHQHCDDGTKLEPGDVLKTLGAEGSVLLAQVFGQILGTRKASGELSEWLVNPPLKLDNWRENLEGLANSLKGDLRIINYIGGSTALVETTQLVADTLKQAGYSVNPNGRKFATAQ